MKIKINISLSICVLSLSIVSAVAKPLRIGNGDHGRAKMAEKYFLAKNYEKATPLFAQLVSNHANNYKYNYYYGVCLLITHKDKTKAVQYLETAIQRPKTPDEIYYYLGKAYHLNYLFDEGARALTEFNLIIKPKKRLKWNSDEPLEWCYNAKRILDRSRDSIIMEKTETPTADFFSKYVFSSNCGKMLAMPDEYKTKNMDEANPTVFLAANNSVMFYSAYNKETSSRDIFRVEKQSDGRWAMPMALGPNVNTKADEMNPTCSADGRMLFFSSKGHQSTGGFDLFKSVYSMAENSWSPAENMASPYSSPFDDYCYLPSIDDKVAYFASTRDCDLNNLMVCKVGYDGKQIPIELKGKLVCIGQPDLKEARIIITRTGIDSVVAEVNTDLKTGEYNVMLPGPGTYTFTVAATGFKPGKQDASFSEFGETYYLQEIYLSRNVEGTEDLAIINVKEKDKMDLGNSVAAADDDDKSGGITMADIKDPNRNLSESEKVALNNAINKSNVSGNSTSTGLEYRVQIGAFKKQTAEETEQHLAKKTKEQFYGQKDAKWNRYFIGHINNVKEARELAKIIRKAGFKGAYVVAFKAGEKIPLLQAIAEEKE